MEHAQSAPPIKEGQADALHEPLLLRSTRPHSLDSPRRPHGSSWDVGTSSDQGRNRNASDSPVRMFRQTTDSPIRENDNFGIRNASHTSRMSPLRGEILLRLTIQPDDPGFEVSRQTGRIQNVTAGSAVAWEGLKVGMTIQAVNGQCYSEKLLDHLMRGSETFEMTVMSEKARYCQQHPLRHREPVRRPTGLRLLYSPLAGAVSEALSFPHKPDCISCGSMMRPDEARWGTGLCDSCYSACEKKCEVCRKRLVLKQLQRGVKLCTDCYNSCEKTCRMCFMSLELGQLHWGTGLCDECYNACEKNCKMCQTKLNPAQLLFRTGLCDDCYSGCEKSCKLCHKDLMRNELHWNSALCDACFDKCQKTCRSCNSNIPLGSLHWQTGLCDNCWDDKLDRGMRKGTKCLMCKSGITSDEVHWGTGLCDICYNRSTKTCRICSTRIDFAALHWGTGLCDNCYSSCEKQCRRCTGRIELGQLQWGTGLCDTCFDSCEKKCRFCSVQMEIGQRKWGTGLCDACYDSQQKTSASSPAASHRRGLSSGVRAAIGAQFVFYVAPAVMLPALYTQLEDLSAQPGWGAGTASAAFAAVLTIASIFAMLAPLPLGIWAEKRGEREVYFGCAMIGAAGGIVCAVAPHMIIFAASWGALNLPPAIRGVRAAFLARNVAPEDLSRAGQLASSAGLLGGFLGPLILALVEHVREVSGNGASSKWPTGFDLGGLIAFAAHIFCAICLRVMMPKGGKSGGPKKVDVNVEHLCERCGNSLSEQEKIYAFALCDMCYDSYHETPGGTKYSFYRYQKHLLISFCMIALFLELSMNASVIATFQPIVVIHFGWGPDAIAAVNFAGAGLSVAISLSLAQMRLPERHQTTAAALLYLTSVLMFTLPPLGSATRMVIGLMLGIKAQILFMSPFTAVFSRLIGRVRVTNRLTTALCLAPAIGGAVGTAFAPTFVPLAGTMAFAVASLPALVAVLMLEFVVWRRCYFDIASA